MRIKKNPTNFHLWPFVMVLLVCTSCLDHIHSICNLSFEHMDDYSFFYFQTLLFLGLISYQFMSFNSSLLSKVGWVEWRAVVFYCWWNFAIFWQRNWENFGNFGFYSVNLTIFSIFWVKFHQNFDITKMKKKSLVGRQFFPLTNYI